MIYLLLFIEFFKTGLFSVGGGLATIPFLRAMGEARGWFSEEILSTMIAVGESTPGPIGVNMATYVGYTVGSKEDFLGSILGSVIATIGLIAPSVIIILCIAKILKQFRENKCVERAFYGVRPAVAGMIAAAGLSMLKSAVLEGSMVYGVNVKALVLFCALLFFTNKFKLHPIIYIIISGVIGAIFSL